MKGDYLGLGRLRLRRSLLSCSAQDLDLPLGFSGSSTLFSSGEEETRDAAGDAGDVGAEGQPEMPLRPGLGEESVLWQQSSLLLRASVL